MKGALVFLGIFALIVFVTLNKPDLPIGAQLYGLLGVPDLSYLVLGIPVTLLVTAIMNGVVYGFVAWLIFTIVAKMFGGNGSKNVNVNIKK
jgi:hypothetical protein